MGEHITLSVDLAFVIEHCITCGIQFGLPAAFATRLRSNGQTFYCPNGHTMWFGKSEADKLRDRLRAAEANAVHLRDQADAATRNLRGAERQLAATKGQVTRLRKRVTNGVCPCCNRTFAALGKHMKSQHPDFDGPGRG
jgi:Zn-finger nucleic acid-binding protein